MDAIKSGDPLLHILLQGRFGNPGAREISRVDVSMVDVMAHHPNGPIPALS